MIFYGMRNKSIVMIKLDPMSRTQIDRMFEDIKIDQEELENCLTGIQKLENRSKRNKTIDKKQFQIKGDSLCIN